MPMVCARSGARYPSCAVLTIAPRSESGSMMMPSSASRRSVAASRARLKSVRVSREPPERRPGQGRAREVHVAQLALLERHLGELGVAEVHRVQLAAAEGDPAQLRSERLDARGQAPRERHVHPFCLGQAGGDQPHVTQPHVAEPGPLQPPALDGYPGEGAFDEPAGGRLRLIEAELIEMHAVICAIRGQPVVARREGPGEGKVGKLTPVCSVAHGLSVPARARLPSGPAQARPGRPLPARQPRPA